MSARYNRNRCAADNRRNSKIATLSEHDLAPWSPPPSRLLPPDMRETIDAFMAAKGARRYASFDSGDDFHICIFMGGKGYKVQRNCSVRNRRAPYFINEKPYSRDGFLRFVNRVRALHGLPPIGPRT